MNQRAEKLLRRWPRFLHDVMGVPREGHQLIDRGLKYGSPQRREELIEKYPALRQMEEHPMTEKYMPMGNFAMILTSDEELREAMVPTVANYGLYTEVEDQVFFMRRLLEHLKNPASFLDVGCGACPYTTFLIAEGYLNGLVVGLDSIGEALTRARQLMAKANAYHPLVEAFGFVLPFASESFEYVFCNDSLHWMKGWKAAVPEMIRVLKPGGEIDINYSIHLPRTKIIESELRTMLRNSGVEFTQEHYSAEKSKTPRNLIHGTKAA